MFWTVGIHRHSSTLDISWISPILLETNCFRTPPSIRSQHNTIRLSLQKIRRVGLIECQSLIDLARRTAITAACSSALGIVMGGLMGVTRDLAPTSAVCPFSKRKYPTAANADSLASQNICSSISLAVE